jgi:hypothetical protein
MGATTAAVLSKVHSHVRFGSGVLHRVFSLEYENTHLDVGLRIRNVRIPYKASVFVQAIESDGL